MALRQSVAGPRRGPKLQFLCSPISVGLHEMAAPAHFRTVVSTADERFGTFVPP